MAALKTQAVDTAVAWSERKVIGAVGMAVDKCGARVQQGVKQDPALPKFVAQLVCDIVAGLLPDIKEEAIEKTMAYTMLRYTLRFISATPCATL